MWRQHHEVLPVEAKHSERWVVLPLSPGVHLLSVLWARCSAVDANRLRIGSRWSLSKQIHELIHSPIENYKREDLLEKWWTQHRFPTDTPSRYARSLPCSFRRKDSNAEYIKDQVDRISNHCAAQLDLLSDVGLCCLHLYFLELMYMLSSSRFVTCIENEQ